MMLSIRPDYELITRYGSSWFATDILNSVNYSYTDLYKENATRSNFTNAIKSENPEMINILGHGQYDKIFCQNNEVLLQKDVNDELLSGKVVFDLSCRSGRDLGSSAVEKGAVAFLGYEEDFWICYANGDHPDGGMQNPLKDQVAEGFFDSHSIAPVSWVRGYSLTDSFEKSQKKWNYWIKVWNEIDTQVAACLDWNKDYQVLKGGERKRGVSPWIFLVIPLLLIPLFGKEKT